jgi:tellurite resistance protein
MSNPPLAVPLSCSDEQILLWLRALLTIAWVDGNFDPMEQELITTLTHHSLTAAVGNGNFQAVTPAELVSAFGTATALAENFLRTAVMVALADGVYSQLEDQLLIGFCEALGLPTDILQTLRLTLYDADRKSSSSATKPPNPVSAPPPGPQILGAPPSPLADPLAPVRTWLDNLAIHDPTVAHFLCKLIPAQCPFERDIVLFGKKRVHIPPMCQLNPLYEQLVGLRFRALSYLADDCGEDISEYC